MEFLNVAREPKLTILGGKLFQTFTTRAWKDILAVGQSPCFFRPDLTDLNSLTKHA